MTTGIVLGSRGLRDFDPALISYAGATVFCAVGLGYRFGSMLERPPTRLYWVRGWQLALSPRKLAHNVARIARLVWDNMLAQKFIQQRSRLRWVTHFLIAWGTILAAAVTFPLTFGWVRFESDPTSQSIYRTFMFGHQVGEFALATPIAFVTFNVLDISAVMVLTGVALAIWRRARDRGTIALQQFAQDLFPLFLLFAVAVTGAFLSLSTHFFRGMNYGFLSQLHAATVIFTLVYVPFGKFFHVALRPTHLSVKLYKEAGADSKQACCARCGDAYASKLHVEDLKRVQRALHIQYESRGAHYQEICPSCRRKLVALAQDGLWRDARAMHDVEVEDPRSLSGTVPAVSITRERTTDGEASVTRRAARR